MSFLYGRRIELPDRAPPQMYGDVRLGDDCEIWEGVVLGSPWPGWETPHKRRKTTIIGSRVKLYPKTIVGAGTRLGDDVICDPYTSIGCGVTVGDRVQFTYKAQVSHNIRIGDDCWIGGFIPENTVIGRKSTVLGTLTHKYPFFGRGPVYIGGEKGPVIGEFAVVSINATVIGAKIGAGAYVGAGTVVTKTVEPGAIMVGNPARRIGWVWERPGCDPELLRILGRRKSKAT